jgi:Smg protein
MIDILFYLFEHYLPDSCPAPDALAKKLVAAGFEDDDISQALDWLAGFNGAAPAPAALAASTAPRLYHENEMARLPVECRGFIAFLEQAEAIDATARELILERALALPDEQIPLNKLKGIVLMVVWRQQLPLDALILEELLVDEVDDEVEDGGGDSLPPLFH